MKIEDFKEIKPGDTIRWKNGFGIAVSGGSDLLRASERISKNDTVLVKTSKSKWLYIRQRNGLIYLNRIDLNDKINHVKLILIEKIKKRKIIFALKDIF
jgi:hypothetical protein